jgi:methyl-accepting chemotaxis protein
MVSEEKHLLSKFEEAYYMKISTKIYGGFGHMLVIMLVIVGVFYFQYQVIEKATHDLTLYRMPLGAKTQKLALEASREAAAIRGYIATGNPKFKQDVDQAMKEVDAAINYLTDASRNKEFVKPVVDATNKFTPHLKKMVELYDTQGQAAASAYLANFAAPDNAALLAAIDKYVQRQDDLVKVDTKTINDQQSKMIITVISILGIGLLLGGVSAVLITRPILSAIRKG